MERTSPTKPRGDVGRIENSSVDCFPDDRMHGAKLPDQRLSARDFDRQGAEFQLRVAVLNGFTAPDIPVTEAVGSACPGKGDVRPSADLCNRARCTPRSASRR